MKPRLVVVGSSNTDMIVRVDHLPRPGETVLGGRFCMAAGGKGANQAVAAARAGARVVFVSRLGRDAFGDQALAGFRRDGLNVRHVLRDQRDPSGTALICVGSDGQNSIAVAPGANAKLSRADVHRARATIRGASGLLLQLETPLATVELAAEIAAAAGVPVTLNPAPACPLPTSLLRLVSVLTPNESETEALTGIPLRSDAAIVDAAGALLAHGPRIVVITLGARGAFVASGSGHEFVPGFRVKVVDSTAAGDVFNGALTVALAEGQSLGHAVRFANAAAALSVTRLGAQPSAPTRASIDRWLARHPAPRQR